MKINWWANGNIKSGIVDHKIGQVFITRKGEHIFEGDVIANDGRGGARENSGRKKSTVKKEQIYAYVDPSFETFLIEQAKKSGLTLSKFIEKCLKEKLNWVEAQDRMEDIG